MSDLLFHPLDDPGRIERLMLDQLKERVGPYLREVYRQNGLDPADAAEPRSWEITSIFDLSDMPSMPGIKIISPGTTEPPKKEGDGTYRATFEMSVVAFVSAKDQVSTDILAKRYAEAIAAAVLQRRSLGSPDVRGIDLQGWDNVVLPADERRTKAAARVVFYVEYTNLLSWRGPGGDPDNPPTPGPPAEKVFVKIGREEDPVATTEPEGSLP